MNKKIVLYLFIGISIFVMACGDDNVGITTTIEDFESRSLALYKTPMGDTNFAIKTNAAHDDANGLFGTGTSISGDALGGKWIYRDDAAVLTKQGDRLSVWMKRSNVTLDNRRKFGYFIHGFRRFSGGVLFDVNRMLFARWPDLLIKDS